MVKTRFAPSPTGLIHLGNARTALVNALFSQAEAGQFLLRMEDTDIERSQEDFAKRLQTDLLWLGLPWQEGVDAAGDAGPYWQSQRLPIYEQYYEDLKEKKLAYPCFCTNAQLALSRKLQRARGMAPRYAGTCRHLTSEEIEQKIKAGQECTLRFRVTENTDILFEDFVKGPQTFNTNDIGDFIIRRSNGMPTFMYCNAIDDALMGVTHAIRGEDHLTNTPRQLIILEALGLPAPQYGHIALILGMDGSPLSKRNGSRSIEELRNIGYLPLAIVNHLARLGHYYENNALMSQDELAKNFKRENLAKSPARYDESQLTHWQKCAIENLTIEAFWQWAGENVCKKIPGDKKAAFFEAIRKNVLFPSQINEWVDIFFDDNWRIPESQLADLKEAGKDFFTKAIALLTQDFDSAKTFFNALKEATGEKGKKLFMPVRLALTGQEHGPEMEPIFQLLGKEVLIKRLREV